MAKKKSSNVGSTSKTTKKAATKKAASPKKGTKGKATTSRSKGAALSASKENIKAEAETAVNQSKVIDKLTPEQEAMIPVYAEKWTQIGLQTGPVDREECIKYAKIAYQKAGLPEPTEFYFEPSPVAAVRKVCEITGESGTSVLGQQLYGNQDACWLSYYEYFWKELGIEEVSILEGLIGLAYHCGWWHAYDTFAVFQDRPVHIKQNEAFALHCEDGPAILYSDGTSIWAIEGHSMTEQIVMRPETLTIEQIHAEQNSDIQAIMIDRFGWPRYLEETGASLLDHRKNEVENTLESLFATDSYGLRLMVTCPTGRVFVKGLPSNAGVTNCDEAQRWLGGDFDPSAKSGGKSKGSKPVFNVIGRT